MDYHKRQSNLLILCLIMYLFLTLQGEDRVNLEEFCLFSLNLAQ